MKVVCIIPARLHSKRFPRKVLSYLGPKPMLQWIWEEAVVCTQFDQVAFAVDHEETAALVRSFRGSYFMTDEKIPSGTDRLVALMHTKQLQGDIWVNWQGDEPFVTSRMIGDLLRSCAKQDADIWTLKKKITCQIEVQNPHVVKVVSNKKGEALYFSRAPIPYPRGELPVYYKHVGLYAYTKRALQKIQNMSESLLEKTESLEQLRFMEEGLNIKVHETASYTQGIDTPEDLLIAIKHFSTSKIP